MLGDWEGFREDFRDGSSLGDWEGLREGTLLGDWEGFSEGFREGVSLGNWEGFRDGASLGDWDGFRQSSGREVSLTYSHSPTSLQHELIPDGISKSSLPAFLHAPSALQALMISVRLPL